MWVPSGVKAGPSSKKVPAGAAKVVPDAPWIRPGQHRLVRAVEVGGHDLPVRHGAGNIEARVRMRAAREQDAAVRTGHDSAGLSTDGDKPEQHHRPGAQ
jgi:hypothetical protein